MPDVQTSWIHIFPWIVCICNRETRLLIVHKWSDETIFMHLKNLKTAHFQSYCYWLSLCFAAWNSLKSRNGSLGTLGPVHKKCMKMWFFGISWYNLATISLTGKSKQTFTKMSRKWPFLTIMRKNGLKLSLKAMSIVKF